MATEFVCGEPGVIHIGFLSSKEVLPRAGESTLTKRPGLFGLLVPACVLPCDTVGAVVSMGVSPCGAGGCAQDGQWRGFTFCGVGRLFRVESPGGSSIGG